jgi:glycosyltransferase involved in cell wall biosynthesis
MPIDFSVVIPTFRRPGLLNEAIASALGQVGVSVEIVVVDDSPEGSAEIVTKELRDPRITYLKNPNPTGGIPSIVRNLGWPRTTGSYVHFLDDDDLVPDGHYVAVKEEFSKQNVGLVFGRIEPFGTGPAAQLTHERRYFANAARLSLASRRFGNKWAFTGRMLFGNVLLVSSASVVRRDCLKRLGGFDPKIKLMEDADFHVRVMRQYGACFMDRVAVLYRIGTPSLMHDPNPGEEQIKNERSGRHGMQAKYRHERGIVEFYLLALFARTVLKAI